MKNVRNHFTFAAQRRRIPSQPMRILSGKPNPKSKRMDYTDVSEIHCFGFSTSPLGPAEIGPLHSSRVSKASVQVSADVLVYKLGITSA